MSRAKQRQLEEINRPRNEELFNNIEKQYQELAKVNAIDETSKNIPQKIVAYNGDPKGQHLYLEQRFEIAEALYNAGYRKQSEDVVEVVRCGKCEHWNNGVCYNEAQKYLFTCRSHYCGYGTKMKGGE